MFQRIAACQFCGAGEHQTTVRGVDLDMERLVEPDKSETHLCVGCLKKLRLILKEEDGV